MAKTIQGRVLQSFTYGDTQMQCGDIAEGGVADMKVCEEQGFIDTDAAAVAYAAEQGGKVVALVEVLPDVEVPAE